MAWHFLDATARAAWHAATSQTAQLEGLAAAFTSGPRVKTYSAAGVHLSTSTHNGFDAIDTTTDPYSITLGTLTAYTWVADGTVAYSILSIPDSTEIVRSDTALGAAVNASARVNLDDDAGAAGLRFNATSALPFYDTPAWRQGLTALTWYEVGGNTLHDIRPTNDPAVNPNYPSTAPWATNGTQSTIITDWGGGAWDETNQRLWIAGGGHACYYGNEPYTIDLDADSPVWVMRGYPTGSIQRPVTTVAARKVGDTDVGQDGRPLSIHTYGLLTVLGDGRMFLGYGGFGYDSSGTAIAEFDPVADDWDMATGRYTVAIGDADVSGSVEYDPTRNKVWQAAGSRVTSYDCAAKTATRNYLSYLGGVSDGVALRRMPEHDLLAVFSGNADSFGTGKHVTLVDPSSPGSAPIGINATTQNWGLRGVAYDTLRKRFLAWNGGGAVETLTPPTTSPKTNAWTYGSLTTSTAVATPSAAHANGTYGRVVYSAKYDCLIVINGTTEQLYVLPLS